MPLLQNCPPGFFSLNKWVFICLASCSARDVKVECQTWRRSPLKRDDCAVSGWMTMAPCASGSDRLECRRRCGRLQSPELVLCECTSAASERGLLGSRHCTQPSAPITELVPSAKMSNGAAVQSGARHSLPLALAR